jgi:predicted aldo/keto reductase-like oxidoreductase
VLATKSTMRDAVGITEHIENSLRMLQTDYLDLFQFHQVSKQEEWEEILGPKGAMEAVLKAQEQGKIRHVGITTHSNSMAIQFIKAELFDTIMVAFNFIEKSPQDEILGLTQKYNIGFLAMKPFAGGVLDNATLAFKFLRQFPTAVPLPGFDSTAQIDEILDLYKEPNIVTKEDFTLMEAYLKDLGSEFCRRCEYCQPCPNGVEITTAMSYPIMVKRMDVAATIAHAEKAMKSFRKCTFCYGCLNECPYKLLIPDILAKNYKMYLQHKNELRNN